MYVKPLSDSEFDSLGDVLKRLGGKAAMNIEQIDGFLAAVVCCPTIIRPPEYLPQAFVAQHALEDVLMLIMRHKFAIAHTLQSGDVFTPVILADRDGAFRGNDWANGFVRGMELRKKEWATLLNDDDHGGSLVPILALAHEHDPDPEMRPYKEPISAERREKLLIGLAAGVMNIYKYFRSHGSEEDFVIGDPTYRAMTPKIGRNEPCPCGSGKKYKHCCGKLMFH